MVHCREGMYQIFLLLYFRFSLKLMSAVYCVCVYQCFCQCMYIWLMFDIKYQLETFLVNV